MKFVHCIRCIKCTNRYWCGTRQCVWDWISNFNAVWFCNKILREKTIILVETLAIINFMLRQRKKIWHNTMFQCNEYVAELVATTWLISSLHWVDAYVYLTCVWNRSISVSLCVCVCAVHVCNKRLANDFVLLLIDSSTAISHYHTNILACTHHTHIRARAHAHAMWVAKSDKCFIFHLSVFSRWHCTLTHINWNFS